MLLKTTITFIFIFSFVRLGGNIFLLPFYPRFSIWGERYRPSGHYTKNLFLTETEITVVNENKVEGSDKENEQEEQTEPVNVVDSSY
jgi:hypothetical protein